MTQSVPLNSVTPHVSLARQPQGQQTPFFGRAVRRGFLSLATKTILTDSGSRKVGGVVGKTL